MDRGAWQVQPMGSQRVRHDWAHTHAHTRHHWPCHKSCGILVPRPGIEPGPLPWKWQQVSATGPPGNSQPLMTLKKSPRLSLPWFPSLKVSAYAHLFRGSDNWQMCMVVGTLPWVFFSVLFWHWPPHPSSTVLILCIHACGFYHEKGLWLVRTWPSWRPHFPLATKQWLLKFWGFPLPCFPGQSKTEEASLHLLASQNLPTVPKPCTEPKHLLWWVSVFWS